MATSMTKVGGVVVITQVIQQDDTSIPLQSSPQATPTCPPAAPPAKRSPPPAPKKLDDFNLAFLQGGPQALGVSFSGPWEGGGVFRPGGAPPWSFDGLPVLQVIQILVGLMFIAFGLRSAFSSLLLLHAPLCLAVTVGAPQLPLLAAPACFLTVLSSSSVCDFGFSDFGGAEDFSVSGESLPAMRQLC